MKKQSFKRFGAIAVEKGFVTEDQLIHALQIQAIENVKEGKHRLLGQILLEEGILTSEQIDEILETMNQQMIYMVSVGR
jgi:hypothetical protein